MTDTNHPLSQKRPSDYDREDGQRNSLRRRREAEVSADDRLPHIVEISSLPLSPPVEPISRSSRKHPKMPFIPSLCLPNDLLYL